GVEGPDQGRHSTLRLTLRGARDFPPLPLDPRPSPCLRRPLAPDKSLALARPALVPLARHLGGKLPIAESKCEGHSESNGAEQDRERRRDDVRRNAQLLQCHEDGEQYHAPPTGAGQRASTVQPTRRCLNQTADESTEHD